MDKIRVYDVSFSGLKQGKHTFEFNISQAFFDLFEFEQDFRNPDVSIILLLEKHSTFLELNLEAKGEVSVICDVSDEEYAQDIQGDMELVVKFGHEFDDSDDEVWIIPEGESSLNIAQLIYELILLNIPIKRVNPNLDSKQAQKALNLLEKYAPKASEENLSEDKSNDPRWDTLKELFKKK